MDVIAFEMTDDGHVKRVPVIDLPSAETVDRFYPDNWSSIRIKDIPGGIYVTVTPNLFDGSDVASDRLYWSLGWDRSRALMDWWHREMPALASI